MNIAEPRRMAALAAGRRGFTSRQYLIAAAVAAVVSAGGFGGYLYYRSNSPYALAAKAQIALSQNDTTRAMDYLNKALGKNPSGDIAIRLRTLMARAKIDAGREDEARPFLQEALSLKANDAEALDLMAESHVHAAVRKLAQALKPLADGSIKDILGTADAELAELGKLAQDPRTLVAEAQLNRLEYTVIGDQYRKANAQLTAAKISQDPIALDQAQRQLAAMENPAVRRDRAEALLNQALKIDPTYTKAAQSLVRYEYEDHHYSQALALYEQLKAAGVMSSELTITGADIMMEDAGRQPVQKVRFADAQKELEGYLAAHPKEGSAARMMAAIGQTLLLQDKIPEATAMATRATAQSPGDLDAQILLINCKLREKKTAEALSLVMPLTNSNPNVPMIWYLLGEANADAGDLRSAEDAFKKSLALNPGFTQGRRELLANDIRSGNMDAAVLLASQEMKEDRYYVTAWAVTADDLQKHGQLDRARSMLTDLSQDPELPADTRPDVIQLLLNYNLPDAAEKLLASMPAKDEATDRLRALVAAAGNRVAEARALLAKDIEANPDNTDLRLRYVELLLRSNLAPDARGQLDHIVAAAGKNPISAADWLRVSRGYLLLRLPEQALSASKEALKLQPRNLEAQSAQQQATAMLTGTPATQGVDPNAVRPDQATLADTVRLAASAIARKDYENALSLARGGLAKESGNVALHHLSARALAGLGQYDQAVNEIVAAAHLQTTSPSSFAVFVELFPTAETALKGLGYGSALSAVNPALGNWAMGRLSEVSGNPGGAMAYYRSGINNASNTLDPGAAKDVLYRAVLDLDAQRKDAAALKKDADTFAAEPAFTIRIRLLTADQLRSMGDTAGVAEQLDKLTTVLGSKPPAEVLVLMAQRWEAINHGEQAISLLEKYLSAAGAAGQARDPQLLEEYAAILEERDPDKSLAVRQELAKVDPSNPRYQVAIAQAQAATGDEAGVLRTLDAARSLGETGQSLARTARLRFLISRGLLKEAADEISQDKAGAQDDASMLAIGQGWMMLSKPDEARKILSEIPAYAAEYPMAVVTLAALDTAEGKFDAAIAALSAKNLNLHQALFQTYLIAGKSAEALDLAKKQLALYPAGTPGWRMWSLYAATAARESKRYGDAVAFLEALDPEAKKASASDIALLQLLQNKPADAAATANMLTDEAPIYNRSTILLLAGALGGNAAEKLPTNAAVLLDAGPASTVYAYLAVHFPKDIKAGAVPEIARNSRVISQDVDALLAELSKSPENAAARLGQLALSQRLIEKGWTTAALSVLDAAEGDSKSGPATTLALLQRHRADTDLHRTAEASAIAEKLSAKAGQGGAVEPSIRILMAAVASEKHDYAGAIAALEPLTSLNRPDILTALASFHEKMGELDKAIALHRQVRQLDPGNVLAANNLAYTLAAAHPTDKAALAEAKTAAEFAVSKAPQVPVFQDTLAWVEILSGDAQQGTRRLAKVLPNPGLRLQAPAHYHLGVGYAKLGQTDLARLHLQNVSALAGTGAAIPEIGLAGDALKTLASSQK